MAKPPTPQGISRLLAGRFPRSESTGRSGDTSGFIVGKDYEHDGAVRVRHHFRLRPPPGAEAQKLAAYAEVIAAAGWTTALDGWGLTVTAPAAPEPTSSAAGEEGDGR